MSAVAPTMRIAAISARFEVHRPGRMVSIGAQLCVQLFLTRCLWSALFSSVSSSAGLSRGQAVTYAVLGVLYSRLRGPDTWAARDNMLTHVREGSILYWYMRPLAPARYHWLRAVGDQAYGFGWAVAAYAGCLAFGLVKAPASAAAVGVFAVTLGFGLVVIYYLTAIVDVACFWTINSLGLNVTIRFVQALFAGAIAPLWFFPHWFRVLAACLPFQSSLHVPLSVYIGRIEPGSAVGYIAVQLVWMLVLAVLVRQLWRRADHRVVVQGG